MNCVPLSNETAPPRPSVGNLLCTTVLSAKTGGVGGTELGVLTGLTIGLLVLQLVAMVTALIGLVD